MSEQLVEKQESKVDVICDKALQLRVVDNATFGLANTMLLSIKDAIKQVKNYWETPKKTAYQAYKEIQQKEKEMVERLLEAEKVLKGQLGGYVLEQEEEKKRLQAEVEEELGISVAIETDIPKNNRTSFITDYDIQIENGELVPNEYKVIDTALIKKVVKATKGKLSIPGVKIIEKKVVRVK